VAIALFPGQGSLKPGMGTPWVEHDAFAVIDEIGEITGVDVRHLLTDAPSDELIRTDNAQLATFALSTAIAQATRGAGATFDTAIGHSLGEYSALVCASILTLPVGAALVLERGKAMAEAADAAAGSMVAILGSNEADVSTALRGFPDLVVANRNAPGQIVVAGSLDQLEQLQAVARELGLRRIISLEVGGAFHSPLMAPARRRLDAALADVVFAEGTMPVVANVDGTAHRGGPVWRELLSAQLTGSVEFEASIANLPDRRGPFVECGPGGVLGGLVRRIDKAASVISLATPDDLAGLDAFDG
jgi:[acyl-carrier-protein] S-malonyltransferase